jgi:hypothetical protein
VILPGGRAGALLRLGAVTLLFAALTAVMTWPQVEYLGTRATPHQDVYFNLWRLGWVAHALHADPSEVFDGNIFYPERRTLTYSDAMLVEGTIGAPLLWAGVPPVLVHNLLLLGAIVVSAVCMFVLVRMLTGSSAGGIIAGIIFAFAPYRFEHYMHMELQWTMWMPLSFWALHRTMRSRSWRTGLLTGCFVGLQMLSSIYYGIFLITVMAFVGLLLLISLPRAELWGAVKALAPGVLAAAVICGAYAVPYLATKAEVGGRGETELVTFSARPSSYLVSTPENVVWGQAFASRGRPERRLFPGALAALLAIVGLLLRPPAKVALAYLAGLALAFDMSLGLSGYSFRFLYEHVPLYHGLRALARFGVFVLFFLAALAAYGYTAIAYGRGRRARAVIAVAFCAVLLAEYRVRPLMLVPYPNSAPPVYAWLASQPPGVVADMPLTADPSAGADPAYAYMSTFHWQPIVNGYSGFFPASYVNRLSEVSGFPDRRSIHRLREDGVRYIVVHLVRVAHPQHVLRSLRSDFGLAELTRLSDGEGDAVVFALR